MERRWLRNLTVTKIYRRSTPDAIVTKISKLEHKVANYTVRMTEKFNVLHPTGDIQGRLIVSAYRYTAITNLPIIAVFVEYLGQFLIDFNQIYRHSSVP